LLDFGGTVALVTGGGGAIGGATAMAFARQGGSVVVTDMDLAAAQAVAGRITAGGGIAVALQCDVTRPDDPHEAIEQAVDTYGRLDILANVAGASRDRTVEEMSESDWNWTIDVNLTGAFRCIRAALPHLEAFHNGRIVNVSSFAVDGAPWFRQAGIGRSNYAAAKAGLIGMTRTLAGELASKGVRVNAVAPGPIATERNRDLLLSLERDPAVRTPPTVLIPLGRIGSPEEVANAILFLASDEASYITGEVLRVSGGL